MRYIMAHGIPCDRQDRPSSSGMTHETSLDRHNIIAFIPIVHVAKARTFYVDVLGLRLAREEVPFALVFDANGIMLRLAIVDELVPAPWTVLGWEVPDVETAVRELESSGVRFERFAQLDQDEHGIWNSPNGARVAWFKDPDGNVLSLSERAESLQ
jgi:catechol 2,3-dioxygenase-like lactoylglutathione lyase family enzyme